MRILRVAITMIGILVSNFALASEIHIQAPGWLIEKIGPQSPLYALTGADLALTLPSASDQPVFLRKLSARAIPKTSLEWSQLVLAGRKANILNQSLKFQNGRPRYVIEFEFPYSQESTMRALVLATVLDGEVYSLSYGRNSAEFAVLAPEILKLFRTVKLSTN